MDAEKETDSNKSAPSHCKTEREEPSIKNAAEAEGSKNESDAEADGVSQAADEAECVLEVEAIETPEVSGEGGIQGHDPEQTEEGSGARSPHANDPNNLPVLSEAKAQSNAYRCKKCGAALEGDAAFCPKCGTATSPSSAACAGKLKANKKVFGIAGDSTEEITLSKSSTQPTLKIRSWNVRGHTKSTERISTLAFPKEKDKAPVPYPSLPKQSKTLRWQSTETP